MRLASYPIIIFLQFAEDETDQEEVRGDSDGEHSERGQFTTETKPKEEVEQYDMEAVVHEVGTAKANAVLGRGLLLEGEVGRHIVIGQETEYIANGISHIDVDPMLENPVASLASSRESNCTW